MIIDYKETTLSFPSVYIEGISGVADEPQVAYFKVLQCPNCCHRSILAFTAADYWRWGNYIAGSNERRLQCNRCKTVQLHLCYNPAYETHYCYTVSEQWAKVLGSNHVLYDHRQLLLDEQIDRKTLRLIALKRNRFARPVVESVMALRFRQETKQTRIKKRLAWMHEQAVAKQAKIERQQLREIAEQEETERLAAIRKKAIQQRYSAKSVFVESESLRGVPSRFLSIQRQEYGDFGDED
jgi:hypothetical protein